MRIGSIDRVGVRFARGVLLLQQCKAPEAPIWGARIFLVRKGKNQRSNFSE